MGFFKCQTCGSVVVPKNKKLSCCGITETLKYAKKANEDYRRDVSIVVQDAFERNGAFPEVISHMGDDDYAYEGESDWYEGIPNE